MHQNMLCILQSAVWSLQNNSMWFGIPEQHCCWLHTISTGVHTCVCACTPACTHTRVPTYTYQIRVRNYFHFTVIPY